MILGRLMVMVVSSGAVVATIAAAGDLRGRVVTRSPEPVVVFLRGNGMVTTRRGGPSTHECTLKDGHPEPATLLLRARDRVRFTNADDQPRRLFAFEGSSTVDLGVLAPGASLEQEFSTFGSVELYTDAPDATPSVLLVLENPFQTGVDAGGRFLLDGVPTGAYEVWAWQPIRRFARAPVTIPDEGAVEATLTLR